MLPPHLLQASFRVRRSVVVVVVVVAVAAVVLGKVLAGGLELLVEARLHGHEVHRRDNRDRGRRRGRDKRRGRRPEPSAGPGP